MDTRAAEKIDALRAVEIRRLRALARAGDAAAERALKRRIASPRQPTQHLALPVVDDFQDAAEPNRIYAGHAARGWVYYINDDPAVPFGRLDSQLRRYPRGTVFRWTDNLEYTLQSWYIDTDAEIARVAAVLARHGMRISR